MKRIGIVTFHNAYNYGAFLQCFALQEVVKKINSRVEIVNYIDEKIRDSYRLFPKKNKSIKSKSKDIMKYIYFGRRTKKRYKEFDKALKKYINLSNITYYSNQDIQSIGNNYDILITGSDQVWNRNITGELSNVYTLNFHNPKLKKISYAASIGDCSLVEKYSKEYKDKISIIDYISVREFDAQKMLKKLLKNDDIQVVLDPTLLLESKKWDNYLDNYVGEKYILAYVVSPDEEYMKIVNYLAKKTGLKIIYFDTINHGYEKSVECESAYEKGPFDFVKLIKNAEYVVATSFHATAFSIIYHKKFFIIPHRKTGARVTNLLNMLNIKGRNFQSYDEFKNVDFSFETNWNNVDKILKKKREESIDWLYDAIGED